MQALFEVLSLEGWVEVRDVIIDRVDPVLNDSLQQFEYTAPVCHHSLNKSQTNQIQSVQRRVMRIIVSFICYMLHAIQQYSVAAIQDLAKCRDLLLRDFFKSLQPHN